MSSLSAKPTPRHVLAACLTWHDLNVQFMTFNHLIFCHLQHKQRQGYHTETYANGKEIPATTATFR